jgi:adenosylcobinamide kinase/adenosylcobinamide-phosphate guanylyltransferase
MRLCAAMEADLTTTLILGGARSGKTRFAQDRAEFLATRQGVTPTMIVTAQAWDDEMADRISRHRADRGDRWTTIETPLDLAGSIAALASGGIVVVDCLTLWLSNTLAATDDPETTFDGLIAAIRICPARLVLVSNEVGWGIVPDNALARRFRDLAGRLHQRLAAEVEEVILVVAGLPLALKRTSGLSDFLDGSP